MISRKEKTALRNKARKKRVIMISAIIGVIVTLVACVLYYLSGNRNITSIEEVASKNTDVLFISQIQDGTWDYFMYMSGYEYPQIDGAKTVGYANADTKSFLYLTGDTDKIKSNLEARDIPYGEKNDVIALGHDGWNFSDDSLADDMDYVNTATEIKNKTTFAYINFEALGESYPDSYYHAVPQLSVWFGAYENNVWNGATTIDKSRMNETEMKDEVSRNPLYRNFIADLDYQDNQWNISLVTLELLADINYETNINLVKFNYTNDTLSLTIGQEN